MQTHKELINKYFSDELTDSELKTFNQLNNDNKNFQEELEFQQKIKTGFQNHERRALKRLLINIEHNIIHEQTEPTQRIKPFRTIWPYITAASLILILGVSYFFNQEKVSNDFDLFYETYPNVVNPITRNDKHNPAEVEKSAFMAYENEKFQEADSLFNIVNDQHKEYILFYKGITKIELKQYDSAQIYFSNYLYSDGMQFRDQAKWYMALSFLVAGDTINGKKALEKLKENSGYKMEEVNMILHKLKYQIK